MPTQPDVPAQSPASAASNALGLSDAPDAPDPAVLDPDLLADGDRRNVTDQYRFWTIEAIKADMEARRDPDSLLHIAIENWEHDFNIGSVVRTANAFNAAGVHIIGKKRWNRRGAMVTDRYLNIYHHLTPAHFANWVRTHGPAGMTIVGMDNFPGSLPLETYTFTPHTALVFGQESTGLTQEMQDQCRDIVHITQHGSTRSLNAGAAAAIAMYAWSTKG